MAPVRIEGDRQQEILDATVEVLAEVGYDQLTMDAVAARAKASKATLYRRWDSKDRLVVDALCRQKAPMEASDTGSLRGDLVATFCQPGGLNDPQAIAMIGSVITAMCRDDEFAATYRRDFIGPKQAIITEIFERARARGEIRNDADLDVIIPALPGILLHRTFLLGDPPTPELIARVIDQVILPAVTP